MSFDSLDGVLAALKQQSIPELQQYHRLLESWQAVVEPSVALQTRPLYVSRQILWVATSSSVWAQTLSLQRYALLKKLNAELSEPLVDIRFSTAQWHKRDRSTAAIPGSQGHPSRTKPFPKLPPGNSPQVAFERWSEQIRARSPHQVCPSCQCPTPEGELQRWGLCYLCTTKQWQ